LITEYERERLKTLLKKFNGRHSDTVLRAIMKELSCGPMRASHLLHDAVHSGAATIDGLKVRTP